MTKDADLPEGFDFEGTALAVCRAVEAIPNETCSKKTEINLAKQIARNWRSSRLSKTNLLAKSKETERLDQIERLTKSLGNVWRELDPELKNVIQFAAQTHGGVIGPKRYTSTNERQLLQFMVFGGDVMERLLPIAREAVENSGQLHKGNFAEIRAVRSCADVWFERTGDRPKSASKAGFVDFVSEVFVALGVAETVSAENTIRRWREIED